MLDRCLVITDRTLLISFRMFLFLNRLSSALDRVLAMLMLLDWISMIWDCILDRIPDRTVVSLDRVCECWAGCW